MKLFADGRPARFVRFAAALIPALALGACGIGGGSGPAESLVSTPSYGPQGDYPVVVGQPYSVNGTTYTPDDVLNYDQVGFLAADRAGGNGISGSHHTLPLPSYVEVTSLETGRTILVRLERRGPMNGQELIALSNGALAQLEAAPGTPVRMRRVNPPEDQRALLRRGMPATLRMDTPMSLVEILKRRLPGQSPERLPEPVVASSTQAAQPGPRGSAVPPLPPLAQSGPTPNTSPAARQAAPRPAQEGAFVVQAAAFSTSERAEGAANVLGGGVIRSGKYFRVRTGPFATRGEAEASLAKVRAAGYSDARILTSG